MRLMIEQDRDKILNEAIDDSAKSFPLLVKNMRSENEDVRKSAWRVIDMVIEELESPD